MLTQLDLMEVGSLVSPGRLKERDQAGQDGTVSLLIKRTLLGSCYSERVSVYKMHIMTPYTVSVSFIYMCARCSRKDILS